MAVPAAGGRGERARRPHSERGVRDPLPLLLRAGELRSVSWRTGEGRVGNGRRAAGPLTEPLTAQPPRCRHGTAASPRRCLGRLWVFFLDGAKRSLSGRMCRSLQEWEALGVEQLRLGTVDLTGVPTLDNLHRGVEFILKHRERGNSVYVHCKAGRSRSATVVAAYLIQVRRALF